MENINTVSVNNSPPRTPATDPSRAIYSGVTALGGNSFSLWATYTSAEGVGAPKGKCWVEFEVYAFPVWIMLSNTNSTVSTRETGYYIPEGAKARFYLDPTKDLFLDVYCAGGAANVKWRVCGPPTDRSRQ